MPTVVAIPVMAILLLELRRRWVLTERHQSRRLEAFRRLMWRHLYPDTQQMMPLPIGTPLAEETMWIRFEQQERSNIVLVVYRDRFDGHYDRVVVAEMSQTHPVRVGVDRLARALRAWTILEAREIWNVWTHLRKKAVPVPAYDKRM